ncbi:MAG: 30S ribosomal protein S12 methylthiotransferase RimO [Desulfovibrionaceae bacterium]|jgi:tRNA-2-methylthio-N6-dimethylallyladenosine synthase/ribosomal protein S12 methylthiotransferase|nr:30S ribosomal protein S12 methylthiotransferase RimO [Desulfovibrionaceae bacterium]
MLKVYAVSLGCPKNRVDTEVLLGALSGAGVEPVESAGEADLTLINTCGFIRPAVEESVRAVLDAADAIAEGDGRGRDGARRPVLAVAGCLVSRYGAAELARELPEVDVWLATDELAVWPERIAKALGATVDAKAAIGPRAVSTPPSYAYLKIAEGCAHDCAFCTIPSIRGPLRSAPQQVLLDEARALLDGGARELVLVAQDSTAYGDDFGGTGPDAGGGLVGLAEGLLALDGLARLRLMYLYPAGLSGRFMDFLAANCARVDAVGEATGSPLLPYFDVPLQHAHPKVLARMGRPFARDVRKVVERIRGRLPGAALRTTLITGFPGETDEHFRALAEFVRETRFAHLGVFAYEREEGTPAHDMEGQVERAVAEARRDELMALQAEISAERLAAYEGARIEVLVDAEQGEWPGLFVGRAWFQAPEVDGIVYVSGEEVEPGRLVACTVEEAKTYDLVALAE